MPVTLEHVFYTYNLDLPQEKTALSDISLAFPSGGFTAIIGKTGSGKSTLLQHLNGLLLPTSGKVIANNTIIDMSLEYKKDGSIDKKKMKKKHDKKINDIKALRKQIGIVFQFPEYQLFEETVLKDVAFGPKNFGYKQEEAISLAKEAILKTGLDESYFERSPFELSGGEKRRVAIAGILALKPSVLVLDEPTVGLDPQGEENLMNLIYSLTKEGTSIIIATHNMDVVLKYATRIIVLDKGVVVKDETPLELFQDIEFLKKSSLEPPKVFSFACALIDRGMKIDITKVKDSASLASEIVRVKEGK